MRFRFLTLHYLHTSQHRRTLRPPILFWTLFLLIAWLSGPAVAEPLYSPNRLPDPGFESGQLSLPFTGAHRGTLAIDSLHPLTGVYSLRLSADQNNAYTLPWWNQQLAAVAPLDGYHNEVRFSAWAKTSAASTPLRMYVFCLDEAYVHQSFPSTYERAFVSTDWQQITVEHACPQAASYVGVRIQNDAAGTDSWWDDLSLSLGEEASNRLANGGFETGQPVVPFESVTNGTLSVSAMESFIGSHSLKIVSDPGTGFAQTGPSSGSRQAAVAALGGKDLEQDFTFSTWAKAATPGTEIALRLRCLDASYQLLDEEVMSTSAGEDWRPYSVTHQCSQPAVFLAVQLDVEAGFRTVWFDETRLGSEQPWVNAMRDPGMETASGSLPFTHAVNGAVSIDSTVSLTGNRSLRFESRAPDAYTMPWNSAQAPLKRLTSESQLKLTTWAKADQADVHMSITVFCWDDAYNPMAYPWGRRFFTLGTSWQKLEAIHSCPANSFAGARFDLIDSPVTVWFDETSFYDLDAYERAVEATEPGGNDLLPTNVEFEGVRGMITNNAFFSDTNIDNINTLNGNLVATIPIGQRFKIGPSFDYGLALAYNSNAWATATQEFTPQDKSTKGVPRLLSNAGFGWQLTLGMVYKKNVGGPEVPWPNRSDSKWLYVAPDGSQIFFEKRSDSSYYFSLDGGQVRLSESGNTILLEFADGSKHSFIQDAGATCPAPGGCYRPTRQEDSFGNWMQVSYETANEWHLQDIDGRHIYVEFESGGPANGGSPDFGDLTTRVKKVRMPSFNSTEEAVYSFVYDDAHTVRGCPVSANSVSAMDMSFLSKLKMPETGYDYDFTYNLIGDASTEGICDSTSGLIKTITLPSEALIAYTYVHGYELPSTCEFLDHGPEVDVDIVRSAGVRLRSVYRHADDFWNSGCVDGGCPTPLGADTWQRFEQELAEREVPSRNSSIGNCNRYNLSITDVISSPIDGRHKVERSYHTVTRTERRLPDDGDWRVADYGLPISKAHRHRIDDPDRAGYLYLSKEISSSATDSFDSSQVERRLYRRYATKSPGSAACHELLDEPGCFREDSQLYGELAYNGDRYIHTFNSEYDGIGHFREQTVTSDIPSNSEDPTQVTYTHYTKQPGALVIDSTGEIEDDLPTPTGPWILNLYDLVERSLDGRFEIQEFGFDQNTGFLQCQRTWSDTSSSAERSGRDLSVWFEPDTSGFVIWEEYAGGDLQPTVPLNTMCQTSVSGMEYRIQHQYAYGARKSSQYFSNAGVAVGPKFLDLDIDPQTGLPLKSWDRTTAPSLLTEYSVDKLGRKSSEKRISGGDTLSIASWVYTRESASPGGGRVDYTLSSNGTVDRLRFFFDGLGREYRTLAKAEFRTDSQDIGEPINSWIRQSRYYTDGVLAQVSTTQPSGSFVGSDSHRRRFQEYDIYGRLLKVREPDDKTFIGGQLESQAGELTQINYFGGAVHRQSIRKGGFKTQTWKDAFGRAHWVQADAPESSCGGNDDCDYYRFFKTYYGSHGTTQTVTNADDLQPQSRVTWIDGRGYKTQERLPEKSSDMWFEYDSRGNPTKMWGGGVSLSYVYDRAGRLISVSNYGEIQKLFSYNSQGRIDEATRFTYFDNANTFGFTSFFGDQAVAEVVESYDYDRLGLVSDRSTWMGLTLGSQTPSANPAVLREVDQSWQWDDVGRLVSMDYGTGWTGLKSTPPTRDLSYSYAYRQLNQIFNNGFKLVDHDAYPNGMTALIRYYQANGALDSRDRVETAFNFRPRFKGVVAETPTATLGETGFYNYDGRGNISSIVKASGNLVYGYDASSRLAQYRTTSSTGQTTELINYHYDHFDNMLFYSEDGSQIEVNGATNQLEKVDHQPVSYDNRGNMLGYGCFHMSWDAFDEQVGWACFDGSVQPPDTLPDDFYYQSIYIYNASDERVMLFERTGDVSLPPSNDYSANVFMLRDLNGNLVRELREEEEDPITHFRDNIWAGRSLRAVVDDANGLRFAHLDHLASPRILSGSGSPTGESFRPFGTQYASAHGQRIGFTGHELNRNAKNRNHQRDGNGLTYDMRAREYSPGLSRFLSPDPAQDGWNLYTYVGNNPIRSVDPTGMAADESPVEAKGWLGLALKYGKYGIVVKPTGGTSGRWVNYRGETALVGKRSEGFKVEVDFKLVSGSFSLEVADEGVYRQTPVLGPGSNYQALEGPYNRNSVDFGAQVGPLEVDKGGVSLELLSAGGTLGGVELTTRQRKWSEFGNSTPAPNAIPWSEVPSAVGGWISNAYENFSNWINAQTPSFSDPQ